MEPTVRVLVVEDEHAGKFVRNAQLVTAMAQLLNDKPPRES